MTQDELPSRFAVDFTGATLLGIYRVDTKIADGGMGSVWLGEDTNLGRRVVVKVPHVRFLGEPGFRARFKREITELVRLEHPNIVRILAQGTHEEIPFFVLQYLGGGSLEDRLEADGEAPRGPDVVAPWLRTIAATLDFVHGRGVVHRDVKPENILFDEAGHVFLSDFGVVKALDEDLNVTEAGTSVGSPKYMAPEQGLGQPVEGAADQYGLATAVYEAISSRLPFEGDSSLEILMKRLREQPTPLADLAPDLPVECADAVMRGLATEPEKRFGSCQEFADAFLAGAGIFDRTPANGVPTVEARRPGRLVGAAIVVFAAAVVLAVGFAAGWFHATAPAEDAAFEVTLLSPGAEPRRLLRYRPAPGAKETVLVDIDTKETKQVGDEEPIDAGLPRIAMRLEFEVTSVGQDGDISFDWKCPEMSLHAVEGTPASAVEGMRKMAKSIEGRSGSARMSARGVNRDVRYDTPPPEEPLAQLLFDSSTEMVEQASIPLPKEPVGIGARWEVIYARKREGIRFTQTITFELESIDGNEVRLRIYVAVAGLNQTFEHHEVPPHANARLKSGHGNGEGELVIDLDRLGDRTVRMTVGIWTEFLVTVGEEEKEMSKVKKIRFESRKE